MATLVVRFTWDSDTQDWSLDNTSLNTFQRDSANGYSGNGSIQGIKTGRNTSGYGTAAWTGTWEDLASYTATPNILDGAAISAIQCTEVRTYAGLTSWTKMTSCAWLAQVYGSGWTAVDLFSRSVGTTKDTGWVSGSGTERTVPAGLQPSTSTINLTFRTTLVTDNTTPPSQTGSGHEDYFTLTITYTTGGPQSRTPTGIVSAEALGSVVAIGPQSSTPTGISSGEALGSVYVYFTPYYNTTGLVWSWHAEYARGMLGPGSNADPTDTVYELVEGKSGTSNLAGTSDSGWVGDGSTSNPYAASLDGNDDRLTFASDADLNIMPYTMLVWFYPDDPTGDIGYPCSSSYQYTFRISTSVLSMSLYNGAGYSYPAVNTSISTPGWYCFAASISNGSQVLYLNGQEDSADTYTYSMVNTTSATYIGRSIYSLDGKVAAMRIWDRVLSASEILAEYELGPTWKPSGAGTQTATPSGVASGETLGSPHVVYNQTSIQTAIDSAEAIGSIAISTSLTAVLSGIASGEVLGSVTVSTALAVAVSGVSSGEVLGSVVVSTSLTVTVSSITSSESTGSSSVSLVVYPIGVESLGGGTGEWQKVGSGTYSTGSSVSSVSPAKPTGVTDGDIMFALLERGLSGTLDSAPSGWTLLADNTPNSTDYFWLYYKVAGGSEPSSYTWTFGSSGRSAGLIVAYRGGFDTLDPIDAYSNTVYAANDYYLRAAEVMVSSPSSPLLFVGGVRSSLTLSITPETGFTEDYEYGDYSCDFWSQFASCIVLSSGATGIIDATMSVGTSGKHAFLVALNPGGGSPAGETTVSTSLSVPVSGIDSAESLGSVVFATSLTVAISGISSAESVGSVSASVAGGEEQFAEPTGITSGEALGSVMVSTALTVAVSGVSSGEVLGSVVVSTSLTVPASGIASGEAVGSVANTTALTVPVSGATSAEALGSVTIILGAVIAAPTGIASAEACGTATALPGAVTATPTGVTSSESLGVATATITVFVSSITSAESLGSVTTSTALTIAVSGIGSSESVGTAAVSATGAPQDVAAGGLTSAESMGSVSLLLGEVTREPAGIASEESIGEISSVFTISASGITTEEQVGSCLVSRGVPVDGISSEEQTGALLISRTVPLLGITSGESLGSPTVYLVGGEHQYVYDAGGIPAPDAYGTITILCGEVTRTPDGIATSEETGTSVCVLVLNLSAVSSEESVGEVTASLVIPVSSVGSAESVGSTEVVLGELVLSPASIESAEATGTVGVLLGAVLRSPDGILTAEAVGVVGTLLLNHTDGIVSEESIGSTQINLVLYVAGIQSTESFGEITTPGTNLIQGIESGESLGSVSVVLGAVSTHPDAISSGEYLGLPVACHTVYPVAIADGSALGEASASLGAVFVYPDGIVSGESLGSVVLSGQLVVVGIDTEETIGEALVSLGAVSREPIGVESGEGFGSVSITFDCSVTAIISAESIGQIESAFTLAVDGVGSVEETGVVSLALTLLVEGIPSAQETASPIVLAGSLYIPVFGIQSAEVFGVESILFGAVSRTPDAILSAEDMGDVWVAPTQFVDVTPVESGETTGVPEVTLVVPAVGVSSVESCGSVSVSLGPVQISAAGVPSGEVVGQTSVLLGGVICSPDAVLSAEATGTVWIVFGSVPQGIASAEQCGLPTVSTTISVLVSGALSAESMGLAYTIRGQFATPVAIASAQAMGRVGAKTVPYGHDEISARKKMHISIIGKMDPSESIGGRRTTLSLPANNSTTTEIDGSM